MTTEPLTSVSQEVNFEHLHLNKSSGVQKDSEQAKPLLSSGQMKRRKMKKKKQADPMAGN